MAEQQADAKLGGKLLLTVGMLDRNVDRITVLVKGFLGFARGFTPTVQPIDPNASFP